MRVRISRPAFSVNVTAATAALFDVFERVGQGIETTVNGQTTKYEDSALAQALRDKAVLVRHFRRPERIAPFLRITVGLPGENAALVAALRDILR